MTTKTAKKNDALMDKMRAAATRPKPIRQEKKAEKVERFTLDLPKEQYKFLYNFAIDAEVPASKVLKAMLTRLETDVELAKKINADLASG
jgi:hypothetical protein